MLVGIRYIFKHFGKLLAWKHWPYAYPMSISATPSCLYFKLSFVHQNTFKNAHISAVPKTQVTTQRFTNNKEDKLWYSNSTGMLHSNKKQIATHTCVSLTDIIASQRTRYQRAHMIPFMHISNKLNESMVLEIRIVVTLLGTVLIGKGFEGDFYGAADYTFIYCSIHHWATKWFVYFLVYVIV